MYIKKVGGRASFGSGEGITFAYALFTMDYDHYFRGDTRGTNLDSYIANGAALIEANLIFMLQCWRENTVFNNFKFQIEVVEGTTAPTIYTPYRGDMLNLALPRTVYGGEVDAVTGAGAETWKLVTLDGAEGWEIRDNTANTYFVYLPSLALDGKCSHFANLVQVDGTAIGVYLNYTSTAIFVTQYSSIDAWTAYLAAQAAAGTPVQIAYKLATSTPITATGNGPIMPLEGETNTIMTDADSVSVTGRADPIRIIQQLQAAQSAAAQQLAETQQDMIDTTAMTVDYIYQQDLEDIGLEEVDDSDNQTDTEPVDVPGV